MLLLNPPPRAQIVERMEGAHPRSMMEGCLRELARLNRLLGVHAMVLAYLARFVRPTDRHLTVLDVATGGADLPRAFVGWARRRGLDLRVIAIDHHPTTAVIARDNCADAMEVRVIRADARALPLADRSVDVAVLTTAMHHLAPADAVRALVELSRVSRRGVIVTDLIRSRAAYLGARALALAFLRNPLTRADGPLSVLRAYTPAEVRALARAAGLNGARIHHHPLFRLALVQGT